MCATGQKDGKGDGVFLCVSPTVGYHSLLFSYGIPRNEDALILDYCEAFLLKYGLTR